MRNRQIYYRISSFFLVIISLAFVLLEIFFNSTYFDEIVAIVALIYLIVKIIGRDISSFDSMSVLILLFVIFSGIISSIVSGLVDNVYIISIDILENLKVFIVFFTLKNILRNQVIRNNYLKIMLPIAKLFFLSAFICGVISLFTYIGMGSDERYGLRCFTFVFDQAHQYTACCYLFLSIVLSTKFKMRKIYIFLAVACVLFDLKGPALVFAAISIFLILYFRFFNTFNIATFIFAGVIIILVGHYQIINYFFENTSPRMLLIKYSYITARHFFPFGSGFATFGSGMASEYYSPLYYLYGFDLIWGMGVSDGYFLSDIGWAMYLAQMGFLGFSLFVYFIFRIFKSIINCRNLGKAQYIFLIAIFVQYIVHEFGSAILTSSQGTIGFISIAIIMSNYNAKKINSSKASTLKVI